MRVLGHCHRNPPVSLGPFLLLLLIAASPTPADAWSLVGWNNLGMHCMDPDYSVFALLPPYNTIHAQLIDPQGHLVRAAAGITVTYEAVADADSSLNSTSAEKTNFWQHVEALFGVVLPADLGLSGSAMPGTGNAPQAMTFDAGNAWFVAAGIPITPTDDSARKNTYPLMRLVARDGAGRELARTDIVLPVSDELNCKTCHASGTTSPGARPLAGWVNDPDPERDVRLNVLRLHDERQATSPGFAAALAAAGYDAAGLFATVTAGTPILCARCHASEALPGSGLEGISPLTTAIHRAMAFALDPTTGLILNASDNRSACYRCHPGAVTRCLRGAMGSAVAADGTLAMQCQSCHGSMLDVAAPERTGWLDEPTCQSCHTGTALQNSGALRFTSVFLPDGQRRAAADDTFATTPDTPAPGLSLYQFSTGHGGLHCEACHGSTHAEYPSVHRNDNLQSLQRQGHVGMLVECGACHDGTPDTVDGGPHGLHPVGAAWVERHGDVAEDGGAARCRACHGMDYRGTVLSRAQADRTLDTDFGRKHFWHGFQVGCYTCHRGPSDEHANANHAPVVMDAAASTSTGKTRTISLAAQDGDGDALTLRIVSQPAHGSVGLSGATATFVPEPGFSGTDVFTYAASDGSTDSNLATVQLTVRTLECPCAGDCNASGTVTIDEVVRAVALALGHGSLEGCRCVETSGDEQVTVDEILGAINAALAGCGT